MSGIDRKYWPRLAAALDDAGLTPERVQLDSIDEEGFAWVADSGEAVEREWMTVIEGRRIVAAKAADADALITLVPVDGDAVSHPSHYTSDPSGVECITITRHRTFNIGNAMKYMWRAGLKGDVGRDPLEKQVEDLKKAIFYIEDEVQRLTSAGKAAA